MLALEDFPEELGFRTLILSEEETIQAFSDQPSDTSRSLVFDARSRPGCRKRSEVRSERLFGSCNEFYRHFDVSGVDWLWTKE